jgi:hypothetical protein
VSSLGMLGERGGEGWRGEQFGYAGSAVWVCWVSSLGMLGERETERED